MVPNGAFLEPVDTNGIKGVSMDAAGHWFARGDNDGTEQDWVVRDGEVIGASGEPISMLGSEEWSDALLAGCFIGHVGNGRGDYVIAGMTDNPDTARDAVIFFNGVQEVARESDAVDLDGNGMLDDGVFIDSFGDDDMFLNDLRQLFVVVTLKDAVGDRVGQALVRFEIRPEVGEAYCDAAANSLGLAASLAAFGSDFVSDNQLMLVAEDLPPFAFGLFLVGRERNFVIAVAGSEGNLCIREPIARFLGPGEVSAADLAGRLSIGVDLSAIPQHPSLGPIAAQPGDTFNFQCWYRDLGASGAAASNLTSAVEITFQ